MTESNDPVDIQAEYDAETEARLESEYDTYLEVKQHEFDASQRCPVCQGYIPEECNGDHSQDLVYLEFP